MYSLIFLVCCSMHLPIIMHLGSLFSPDEASDVWSLTLLASSSSSPVSRRMKARRIIGKRKVDLLCNTFGNLQLLIVIKSAMRCVSPGAHHKITSSQFSQVFLNFVPWLKFNEKHLFQVDFSICFFFPTGNLVASVHDQSWLQLYWHSMINLTVSARPPHAMRKQGAGASAASDMSEEPKPASQRRQWFTRYLSGTLSLFESKVASLLSTTVMSNLNQQMGFVYIVSRLFLTRCFHSC